VGGFCGEWLKYAGPCIPLSLKTQALYILEVMRPFLSSPKSALGEGKEHHNIR